MIRLLLSFAIAFLAGTVSLAAQQPAEDGAIRIATFNASLNRGEEGQLASDLADPAATQPARVAEIIQRVNPDVVLINEFDYDEDGAAARLFVDNFLSRSQNGAEPWVPAAIFSAPSNTGIPTGIDLDRDSSPVGPGDAFGFGFFPGQYGMLILSKLPIARDDARTFQEFLWRDMPNARLPDDPGTSAPADYYTAETLEKFRLSSKSHWDVPVEAGDTVIHLLASHPTPPVFDGPEDRNGTRNADEVRFWIDYVGGADYIYDDAGETGGLPADASFVILGDLNLDPNDGDGMRDVGAALLAAERVQDPMPASEGGAEDAAADGGVNGGHTGDPRYDTADFFDGMGGAGNMRVDYVLPSADLTVTGSGIFWPTADDPLAELLGPEDAQTSDHRLVWVDIAIE
ncbi:endonuclease/exonuclease/phosphatase family protein [Pelagibacterium xiamenense]|uniref:endonuclease/exonuclease/phosphatase family protein n=1 Tax=Pelagibacterium xiamenense TaxID=2901140 RepID=UPI001E6212D2|nr:endonuclease/exonuclease/phosphatase family protein [Pelagibacterium xiamenense]MCD7058923.1 endonuclease/exonuclease/phosphatase family protein [Pelagibacterium xiamenense]